MELDISQFYRDISSLDPDRSKIYPFFHSLLEKLKKNIHGLLTNTKFREFRFSFSSRNSKSRNHEISREKTSPMRLHSRKRLKITNKRKFTYIWFFFSIKKKMNAWTYLGLKSLVITKRASHARCIAVYNSGTVIARGRVADVHNCMRSRTCR